MMEKIPFRIDEEGNLVILEALIESLEFERITVSDDRNPGNIMGELSEAIKNGPLYKELSREISALDALAEKVGAEEAQAIALVVRQIISREAMPGGMLHR